MHTQLINWNPKINICILDYGVIKNDEFTIKVGRNKKEKKKAGRNDILPTF